MKRPASTYTTLGAFGIPGYALKGIYEEVQKTRETDPESSNIEAQMVQGFKDWEATSDEEKGAIYLWIKRQIEDLETLEG